MTSNSSTRILYEYTYYARYTTKEYRMHELSPKRFIYFMIIILQYIFTSYHCTILVKCNKIIHLLILMPHIIPFSEKIIISFTIILHSPLFNLPVNQYSFPTIT
jgi:hypothetical protein